MTAVNQLDPEDLKESPKLKNLRGLDVKLKEIRLIRLLANDILIENHALVDSPIYHAISYYWGPPVPTREVCIQGETITIRESVAELLDRLRERYGPQSLFWIDMLSINQRDLEERNSQVRMMADIYSRAINVISWLGEANELTESAFRIVEQQMACPPDELFEQSTAWDAEPPQRDATDHGHLIVKDNYVVAALSEIARRPYWKRVWIAQEVILAQTNWLLCGHNIATLQSFYDIGLPWMIQSQPVDKDGEKVVSDSKHNREAINGWATIRNLQRYRSKFREGGIPMREVLETFARNNCSNPLDKVYGLRTLNKDLARIDVDYTRKPIELFLSVLQQGLLYLDKGRGFQTIPRFMFDMGLNEGSLPMLIDHASNRSTPIPVDAGIIGYMADAIEFKPEENTTMATARKDTDTICIKMILSGEDDRHETFCEYVLGRTYHRAGSLSLLQSVRPGDLIVHVEGFEPIILVLRRQEPDQTTMLPSVLEQSQKKVPPLPADTAMYAAITHFREARAVPATEFERERPSLPWSYTLDGEIVLRRTEIEDNNKFVPADSSHSDRQADQVSEESEEQPPRWRRPNRDKQPQPLHRFQIDCGSVPNLLLWDRSETVNYIL